jgi:nucleoside-diphosphate-sugar epimerase
MIVDTIASYIPDAKIKYGANGTDPRNYKVSFKKVKETLGFVPKYTVKNGIEELINVFKIGVYSDSLENKNKYGNYQIKY